MLSRHCYRLPLVLRMRSWVNHKPLLGPTASPSVRVQCSLGSRQQVLRVCPHRHPVDVEPSADGDHAFAVRSGSSNSVHLAVRQRCSSSSPRVRYDSGVVLDGILRLVANTEFRPLPRGTEPLEPLPGVRFESTRVHKCDESGHRLQICVPAFYFFCLNQWLSLLDFLGPEFCYSWLLRVAPLGVAGHGSVVVSGCTCAGRTDASEHGSCQSLLA